MGGRAVLSRFPDDFGGIVQSSPIPPPRGRKGPQDRRQFLVSRLHHSQRHPGLLLCALRESLRPASIGCASPTQQQRASRASRSMQHPASETRFCCARLAREKQDGKPELFVGPCLVSCPHERARTNELVAMLLFVDLKLGIEFLLTLGCVFAGFGRRSTIRSSRHGPHQHWPAAL